jgi:hypothetical protein
LEEILRNRKHPQEVGRRYFSSNQRLGIRKKKPPDKWFEAMYRLDKKS